ncbi:DinB family protein [Paenibacillus sp. S-38]|uniref:DinB family protein n=1 Tax=Paenibacillus sp. S-38 TaxID=3416710 RepID=UPI003CF8E6DD
MSETKRILQDLELLIGQYEEALGRYSPEQLHRQPAPEAWSVGQVYTHLLNTAFHMQLRAVAACRDGAGQSDGAKTEAGEAVFRLGSFPPIKIAVPPTDTYTPANTEEVDSLRARLEKLKAEVGAIEPQLAAIPEDRRVPHPRLGALNALEWFSLVEMHFRHHLRQQQELDAFLGIQGA